MQLSKSELVDLNCPECGVLVRPIYVLGNATKAAKRKCPKCKTQWQVRITPMGVIETESGEERCDQIEWEDLDREWRGKDE